MKWFKYYRMYNRIICQFLLGFVQYLLLVQWQYYTSMLGTLTFLFFISELFISQNKEGIKWTGTSCHCTGAVRCFKHTCTHMYTLYTLYHWETITTKHLMRLYMYSMYRLWMKSITSPGVMRDSEFVTQDVRHMKAILLSVSECELILYIRC